MASIIHFDYDFSPYGQKTKLLLQAAGVQFQKCDEPALLPRPNLEELGITYRRIPLLAVGKDVYADSNLVMSVALSKLGGSLARSPADAAFQTWGDTVFVEVLGLVPMQVLTPEFVKDRANIFPLLQRPDLKTLRPSSLAQFHGRLKQVEEDFLAGDGPFVNGQQLSVADVHFIWPIKWAFNELGLAKEEAFGKQAYPKLWKLIDALPQPAPQVLSPEDTWKAIREGEYTASTPTSVMNDDPLGFAAGTEVNVESFDSTPGSSPQAGKLVASSADEVILEIKDGVRLHFPRIGYIVREKGTKW